MLAVTTSANNTV